MAVTDAKNASEAPDDTRRSFLSVSALVAATSFLKAQEKKVDGGLATIEDKVIPNRITPIMPPGSQSARNMAQHCTACQLCVSACPNQVLRPSTDLMKLMQPEMSYERGYCRPECTKCSEVCPAGAILPITRADKSAVQIGHAVWVKENCIPLVDGVAAIVPVIVQRVPYKWWRVCPAMRNLRKFRSLMWNVALVAAHVKIYAPPVRLPPFM